MARLESCGSLGVVFELDLMALRAMPEGVTLGVSEIEVSDDEALIRVEPDRHEGFVGALTLFQTAGMASSICLSAMPWIAIWPAVRPRTDGTT